MTIKECIDLVDASKPNQYSLEEKVGWLSFLDGTIINDVLKTHEGYDGSYDLFEGYSTERLTAELIAPSPYDRLYPAYLKMRIDSENGEIARYNNSAALYNVYLMEYKKWYNRTHMPISGAVMGGAKNDIGGCGCESNADVAEKAAISAEEARKSAVRASEKAEEAAASAALAESAKDGADRARDAASAVVSAVAAMRNEVEEDASEVRGLAEEFSEAEAKRVTAEGLRVSAEAKRVSAEDERVASETRREQAMRELIEDVVAATGCKVFDIDMGQYGFGDPEVGETYYLDSGISIPNVRLGDFAFDTVAGYIYKCVRKAEADAIVGDGFLCVAALGGSSGGGGGFRKIGFTSDCDFVATESDGLTAFRGALNAATDGETILVMPGVYKGTERFDVTKNIAFVGIGKPEINFPIWISGGGVFSFENWEWTELYRNVRGTWQSFVFRGDVSVGMEANPDGVAYAGEGVFIDCDFVCLSVSICGSAKSCTFDVAYFTSGHYYGAGGCCTEFDDCTIKASDNFDASSGCDKFVRCDIYPKSGETYITTNWYDIKTFVGCKMYALGTSLSLSDSHSNVTNLNDTIVFANSVSGTSGGYLVKPTAL